MTPFRHAPFPAITLLAALACGSADAPAELEGDAAGECTDAADNDADGAFDCDDSDCSGSPDCDTTPAEDTAPEFDTIGGFGTLATFAYDPDLDVARSFVDGGEIEPTFVFLVINQDFADTQSENDACYLAMTIAGPLARAAWADADSGYLFGVDFDPANAEFYTDECDDMFGADAVEGFIDALVNTAVWGVGLKQDIDGQVASALRGAGGDPTDYIGGAFYAPDAGLPSATWEGFTAATAVNGSWAPGADLAPADAVQDRANETIPTAKTPAAGLYSVNSPSFVVFQ